MKKIAIFFILSITILLSGCAKNQNLQANIADSDYDGVLDKYDKCPHTPFTKLVDMSGCPVK